MITHFTCTLSNKELVQISKANQVAAFMLKHEQSCTDDE